MKKIVLFFLIISFSNLIAQTLLLEENFDYTTGTLTSVTTNWIESPTGSVDIQVVSGSLSFTNYPSSGVGNKIILDGGATGRSGVTSAFTSQSGNGSTVYSSFVLKVTSTTEMDTIGSTGDRFFNFKVSGSASFRTCVFVRQGSTSSKFQIGLGKLNTSTPIWHSSELDVNSEYLIVVAYLFQAGNDAARMWINPDLSGIEPLFNLEQTIGSDATSLGEVQFRQELLSGDMEVDGIRAADSWSQSPLPVELSSFFASIVDEGIKLNWRTETEVNNYGFEVLRQAQDDNWELLGFVEGNGNSNSPKEYTFVDENVASGIYSYRLKQIDNDGQFEYSKVIEVSIGAPLNFELSQNYPNPFNPNTTIKFNLSNAGVIKLTVFDLLGQEVETLINEEREAGIHTINFNASELNSGVYVYKLEADGLVQMRKMVLVK